MVKYILSIDGGGIRGIIPAMILNYIEKRTRRNIADMFDLLAGSSTGGLIVAALCKKRGALRADNIVNLFKEDVPKIYGDRLRDLEGPKYLDHYLEWVLDHNFEDSTFADTKSKVLITSFDIFNNEPYLMSNWTKESRSFKIKDAVRATMAMPNFFSPKERYDPIEDEQIEEIRRVLVSGSMLANNPVAYAYGAANREFLNEKCVCVSLGTGRTKMNITPIDAKDFTKGDWLTPLRQIMISSNHGTNYFFPDITDFIRIDGSASKAHPDIDNVSLENIWALEKEAKRTIRENKKKLDLICHTIS